MNMIKLLLLVWFCGSLSSCATPEPTFFREDMELSEQKAWYKQLAEEKKLVSTALTDSKRQSAYGAVRNPFLYRVEKAGAVNYLLGTMHRHVSWSSFPIRMRTCMTDARSVGFEIDGREDDAGQMFHTSALQERREKQLIGTVPLSKQVSPKAWARIKQDLAPVKPDMLDLLSPTGATHLYITLREPILGGDYGCLDCEIFDEARQKDKHLIFMETWKDRLDVEEFILKSSKDFSVEDFNKAFEGEPWFLVRDSLMEQYKLSLAYKEGDLPGIEKQIKEAGEEAYRVTIADRNHRWMPKLASALASGKVLIAVGVGHMVGEEGLPKLLTKDGYKVDRVDLCEW